MERKTFILVYEHRDGTDVSAYDTETLAMDAAIAIVERNAGECRPETRDGIRALLAAGKRDDALETYVLASEESLWIEETDIHTGAAVTNAITPMCPNCTSTALDDLQIMETFTAYHVLEKSMYWAHKVHVENALSLPVPSEHFDDGRQDYKAHCRSCLHEGPVESFGLGDPNDWEWV